MHYPSKFNDTLFKKVFMVWIMFANDRQSTYVKIIGNFHYHAYLLKSLKTVLIYI